MHVCLCKQRFSLSVEVDVVAIYKFCFEMVEACARGLGVGVNSQRHQHVITNCFPATLLPVWPH